MPKFAVDGYRHWHQRLDSPALTCLIFDSTASKSGTKAPITQKIIKTETNAASPDAKKGAKSQVALASIAACMCHIIAVDLSE
jgi:hypothetical protein